MANIKKYQRDNLRRELMNSQDECLLILFNASLILTKTDQFHLTTSRTNFILIDFHSERITAISNSHSFYLTYYINNFSFYITLLTDGLYSTQVVKFSFYLTTYRVTTVFILPN